MAMSLIISRGSPLGTPHNCREEAHALTHITIRIGLVLGGFGHNFWGKVAKKAEFGRPRWKVTTTAVRNRGGMLEEVANTVICTRDQREIKAFVAMPAASQEKLPVVLLIHEFWGLSPEICGKAKALANEISCITVAPDTYRGQSTRFVPKAIFLSLTTPQERVNQDLDEVIAWIMQLPQADTTRVGIMGFCYGGGKALRYGIKYKKAKAIVVIYGNPVLDIGSLAQMEGGVLGIYGDRDTQFPANVVEEFQLALNKAKVRNVISIYKGQGHAFWRDMDQVRRQEEPQLRAWIELITFMKKCFSQLNSTLSS